MKNNELKNVIVDILNNDCNQSYLQEQEKTFSRQELDLILDEIDGYYLKSPTCFVELIKDKKLYVKQINKLPECKFKKMILDDLEVMDDMWEKINKMWEKYQPYLKDIRSRKDLMDKGRELL